MNAVVDRINATPALRRAVVLFVAFAAIILATVSGPVSVAEAAPQSGYATTVTSGVMAAASYNGGAGVCTTSGTAADQLLPVNRWSDSTSFHSRQGWSGLGGITDAAMGAVVNFAFAVGNFSWSMTTQLVDWSFHFCPVNRVGGTLDTAFASMAQAVVDSGLIMLLFVASVIGWAWRVMSAQGGQFGRVVGQKVMVAGLLLIMFIGATGSTGGGAAGTPKEDYKPGWGSPGWFITTVDQVTAGISQGIVASANFSDTLVEQPGSDLLLPQYDSKNRYSCETYVSNMERGYMSVVKGDPDSNASVALSLNSLWKRSGLETWKKIQFGNNNNYGNIMWCRMLEDNRRTDSHRVVDSNPGSVHPSQVHPNSKGGAGMVDSTVSITQGFRQKNVNKVEPGSTMWNTGAGNAATTFRMIAWAACTNDTKNSTKNWYVPHSGEKNRLALFRDPGVMDDGIAGAIVDAGAKAGELVGLNDGAEPEPVGDKDDAAASCNTMFSSTGNGDELAKWDWGKGTDKINNIDPELDNYEEAKDFLLHLQQGQDFGSLIPAGTYAISSLFVAFAFVLFAGSIIWAKMLALIMILGVLFTLVMALMPNGDVSRIGQMSKQYIGISFYGFAAGVILSILALITTIIMNVGTATLPGGPGGWMTTLLSGIAPVLGLFAMHYMFKKMGMPSPMSVKSAGAWGRAASGGNIGTGVVAGVAGGATAGAMSKWGRRGGKAAIDGIRKRGKGAGTSKDGQGKQTLAPDDGPSGTGTGSETKKSKAEKIEDERAAREEWQKKKDEEATPSSPTLKGAAKRNAQAFKGTLKNRVKEVASRTKDGFKRKPIRTLAKGAMYTGAGVLAVGAGPIGMAVAGAALLGRKNVKQGVSNAYNATKSTFAGGASGARDALVQSMEDRAKGGQGASISDIVAAARSKAADEREWARNRADALSEYAAERQRLEEEQRKRKKGGGGGKKGGGGMPPPKPNRPPAPGHKWELVTGGNGELIWLQMPDGGGGGGGGGKE